MSKYLVTQTGVEFGCSGGPLTDEEFKAKKDSLTGSQVIVDVADLPSGPADFWLIDQGAVKCNDSYVAIEVTKQIKDKRKSDMAYITVSHNSKDWSFSPVDASRFESKIARGKDFVWKSDDGSQVTLTATQAENIAVKVDDALTKIFFDAETLIRAI